MTSINLIKVVGAEVRPNCKTGHLEFSFPVVNANLSLTSSVSETCQYPLTRSRVLKKWLPIRAYRLVSSRQQVGIILCHRFELPVVHTELSSSIFLREQDHQRSPGSTDWLYHLFFTEAFLLVCQLWPSPGSTYGKVVLLELCLKKFYIMFNLVCHSNIMFLLTDPSQ